MHDSTKPIPPATEAFWKEAPFQGPPAETFLWNRLAPHLEALWASARSGDWSAFVDGWGDILGYGPVRVFPSL